LVGLILAGDPEVFIQATHLDDQGRYLLAPATHFPLGLAVFDTQGEDPSYLEQVLDQEAENLQTLAATDKESLQNPQLWLQMGLPAIARHYLSLQGTPLGFPLLRDAWISAHHEILVLEQNSSLTPIADYLNNHQVVYEQLLQWIFQMTKMWRELDALQCGQSLLHSDNLFIDEDENIAIQQILEDSINEPATLVQLAALWKALFPFAETEEYAEIRTIVEQVTKAEILKTPVLLAAIKALAQGETEGETTAFSTDNSQTPEGEDNWEDRSEFQEELERDVEISEDAIPTVANLDQMTYSNEGDEQPTVVLPMHLLNLDDAGLSDIGMQRDHNEDFFGIQTLVEKQENLLGRQVKARGLYVVCDGMGGHAAGEVASALSVEHLQNFFQKHWQDNMLPDEETIQQAIWMTNQKIYDINLKNARSGSGRMGTTLVMTLVQDNRVAIAHVGDSRIYRVSRKWGLEQLTVDHEVGQREIQKGVEPDIAYGRADAYQLTQAIGPRENAFVNPDIRFIEINEDSLFLLCSDGLSDNDLLENCWETHLLPLLSSRANLDQGAKELIDIANEHNGHDNITAVLVRVKVRPNLGAPPIL
jgi:protein phosphatase